MISDQPRDQRRASSAATDGQAGSAHERTPERPGLLWLTPEASAQPRSGGSLRTHRLLRGISESFDVHLVVILDGVDGDALARSTGVGRVTVLPRLGPAATRARAWRHSLPLDLARVWHPDAGQLVSEAGERCQTVVLDHLTMAGYRPPGGRYVAHLHNVEADRYRQLPPRPRLFGSLEHRRDARLIERVERMIVRDPRADVVVVSDDDRDRLGEPCHVVPNGADLPHPTPALPINGDLIFVGALGYPPNQLGLRWWAEEVWPLLPPDLPRLRVIGRGGRAALGTIGNHPALDVVGEVSDVAPHLAAAAMVVVPILHGSGSRLKVLEALAWARPLVTTTKGCEGIPIEDRRTARVADDPAAFASGVAELWRDRVLADQLAIAGRQLAERFSWPAVAATFLSVLREVGVASRR